MALTLEERTEGDECVIAAEGEVDLYSSPQLREQLLKALPKSPNVVAVDLSKVAYMDSSGVATLVEGLKSAGQHNKKFVLRHPSPSVMKVLQLSRLDTIFQIETQ